MEPGDMSNGGGETPDSADFVQRMKPFRGELLAHCYRMLGSVDDAEDVVQETHLRAWRAYRHFEGRSSLRAWLYKIATNGCLTALDQRRRRALPSGLGPSCADPRAPPVPAGAEVSWVSPIPLALVSSEARDPAAVVASQENLRLALIATLQFLPPRQRAVLVLREVLAFTAAEVAEMLDTSTEAVKSTLQRARARLDEVAPAADAIREPTDPESQALLRRYIAAFESSDAGAIEELLCDDATLEMTPSRTWFAGKNTCAPFIVAQALGSRGDWRMVPTNANGQPAAVAYLRGSDGAHHPFGVAVLRLRAAGIAGIVVFGGADVVAQFERQPDLKMARPAGER
jgi:RNA polymerase sigma-70 factor (ECF subfamily)